MERLRAFAEEGTVDERIAYEVLDAYDEFAPVRVLVAALCTAGLLVVALIAGRL